MRSIGSSMYYFGPTEYCFGPILADGRQNCAWIHTFATEVPLICSCAASTAHASTENITKQSTVDMGGFHVAALYEPGPPDTDG